MPSNIYVDTNIIIDICDEKRPLHHISVTRIKAFAQTDELFINSDSLATLFYILRHRAKLSFKETLEKMYLIHDIFSVVAVDETVFIQGLQLCSKNICADYEDAVQYLCAKKIEADLIVTNDKKFVSPDIEIIRLGDTAVD